MVLPDNYFFCKYDSVISARNPEVKLAIIIRTFLVDLTIQPIQEIVRITLISPVVYP